MKVVLFCGGMGTRLKEFSETIPKPMVEVGGTPIILHLMRYYAHFGHKDFIVCLGFGADYIKHYFLNYDECMASDFVLAQGGRRIELASSLMADWTITFVNTGLHTSIGQRLKAVHKYVASEEIFMANYADGLSDLDLDAYLRFFRLRNRIASFVSVRPQQSFHYVMSDEGGTVQSVQPIGLGSLYINGGFFVFKQDIFDYIGEREDLVEEPFQRLIQAGQLITYRNAGFWVCMDTLRDKLLLDEMHAGGRAPWAVWNREEPRSVKCPAARNGSAGDAIVLDRSHLVAKRRSTKYIAGR
jgi:glucose-1-phosphate cytidylyltransferase